MSEQLTDDEQVEAIKKWWKEYGNAIIIGLTIGLALVVGVHYWVQYKDTRARSASDVYNQFMQADGKKDAAVTQVLADKMLKKYKGTSYAALTALQLAKRDIDSGKLAEAEKHLRWAMDNPGHEVIGLIARQRLVEVMIAENKLDAALTLLDKVKDPTFDPRFAALRGDILSKQGKNEQAREAYQMALADSSLAGKQRELLLMKMQDLSHKVADAKQK